MPQNGLADFINLVAFAASVSDHFRTSGIRRLNETETSVVAGKEKLSGRFLKNGRIFLVKLR